MTQTQADLSAAGPVTDQPGAGWRRQRRVRTVARTLEGRLSRNATSTKAPYVMSAPFFLLFLAFFVAPLLYAVLTSLKSNLTEQFAGLANYRYAVGLSSFWTGIERVILFGFIQVTSMIVIALALALLLDSPYCRGKRFFAIVYFLPFAVPSVIAAIMWGFLYSPDLNGLLNIPHALGLSAHPLNPLGSNLVFYATILVVSWEFTGYNMTIYLTGLTSVPREVLEAAQVDGASAWAVARRVKIPMLRRTIIFTLVLSIIGTLQLFNEPQILMQLTPYITSTYTPNLAIYSTAFTVGNVNLAAAESIILAIITILASLTFFRVVTRSERRQRRAETAQLAVATSS